MREVSQQVRHSQSLIGMPGGPDNDVVVVYSIPSVHTAKAPSTARAVSS
jgi:hypothetical protein